MTKIKVLDLQSEGLTSEDGAMLQALYSRSADSVDVHLAKVKELGSSKFMETNYLNYSHKSIGDCGTTTVFFEGLSMPAAKAIQDSPLYNGQECSTRYISYENVDHVPIVDTNNIVQGWYKQAQEYSALLYKLTYEAVTRHMLQVLEDQHIDIESKMVLNAIHAKACDYARGFLLLGAKTQVAWTTTLRQFGDRVDVLEQHPLSEVRNIGIELRAALHERYPASFKAQGYASALGYIADWSDIINYISNAEMPVNNLENLEADAFNSDYFPNLKWNRARVSVQDGMLDRIRRMLKGRPEKVEAPTLLNSLSRVKTEFVVDYGSFRDLQRHRSATVRHSYPKGKLNINKFYLYPSKYWMYGKYKEEFTQTLTEFIDLIARVNKYTVQGGKAEKQYFYPLGQNVYVSMEMGLASAIYIAEIRSGSAVHPTARACGRRLAIVLDEYGFKININWADVLDKKGTDEQEVVDFDHDEIYLARGLQTFKKDT